MTDTLPAGGHAVQVGTVPILLTDAAPITVINPSTTARIWLSGSANAITATGVPVDPGTAYQWQTSGALWAQADPAAAGPVTVIITGSGSEWTPSPVTIGAAVAAELATQGVPSKLLITKIGTWTVSGTQFTIPADLTAYSSVYLVIIDSNGTHPLQYQWYNGPDNVGPTNGLYPDPTSNMEAILAVLGPTLQLYPYPGESWTVTAYGYNRQLPSMQPAWGAVWTGTATPTQTAVALNLTSGTIPSTGMCSCYLQAYPLPSGLNRAQVQVTNTRGSSTPNLILNDYTLPAAGTGIFLPFQAAFPPANNYAPVIRLFSTLTENCSLTLHTVQSTW